MSATTPSLESNLNAVWQFLPQGHEKPLKQAFYNTIANIFVIVAAAVSVAVYFILAPFIRPLYWAVLCGTFLYPFKRSLTNLLRQWLKGLQSSGTPFAVGLAVLPLQVGNSVAESMTQAILANLKLLFGVVFGLPSIYMLYHFTPLNNVFGLLHSVLTWLYEFLETFSSNWVWTIFVAYMLCVVFMWKPSSQQWLRYLSAPVWISLMLHFACVAGPLRVPLFILIVSVLVIGVVVQMGPAKSSEASSNDSNQATTPFTSFCNAFLGAIGYSKAPSADSDKEAGAKDQSESATLEESPIVRPPGLAEGQKLTETPATRPSKITLPTSTPVTVTEGGERGSQSCSAKSEEASKPSMVDQCFLALLWGHVIVRLWMHVWLIVLLLFLPLLHLAFKKICQQFSPQGVFHKSLTNTKEAGGQWLTARRDVLMPRCLRGLGSLMLKGDQKIISILEQGLDQATSILLILTLLVGTFVFTVIGAVQIQRESMYMVTSTQNILNKTVNSEFSQWMPNADMMRKTMDQVLQKTHEHGRNFIASKVKDFLPVDQSSEETENIINQVLEVWDKLYESMLSKDQGATNASSMATPKVQQMSSMGTLWQTLGQAKNMLHISAAVEFVKENLGMFMSVLESVWTVLKSNMNLFFTVITSILSAVLGGGTAILNFVISAIIFLTTLFYLLASSGDMYKPAELFSNLSPGSTGSRFGSAVEHAISGVFMASLKMATFYGLYTWLVHLVFGLDIVFIPSALAACFAAIPFLGPYWAALPAVIELWLVQGQGLNALLLFLAHMMPAYVVDTAIYREIDGSHPYVTGLAIAGGMLFMGLEGAIIGPIILCCLIVVLNMYSNMLQSDPSTPSPARPSLSLRYLLAQRRMNPKGSRSVSSDAIHVH